ncbi:extracellular solute-binding protein [candidate division FCPU426 bacterium]|nr:extracellular solute-binding protein [candidate division FCPU426 bacterium]
MKRAQRILWAVAVLAGMAGIFMSCSCGPKTAKEEQVTITFWHWWADQQPMMEKMAVEYEEMSGVKVKLDLIGQDYFKKLQAAAGANTLPDIIGLAGGGELLARYVKAGRIYELTEQLAADNNAWANDFFPRALEAFRFEENNVYGVKDNSYWGLPISVMNIQIFYHKDLFAQAGLDPEKPPRTWAEFLEVSKKLNEAGIPPFIAGLGDQWIDYTIFNAYCWAYLGADNMKKLYAGELPYTHEGCVKTMQLIVDLRVNKVLYPGAVSMQNKEAEINFANKKAAMMLNGSWAVNVYADLNPDLDLGVFPFPKPADAGYEMYFIGGVGKGCAVTTNSSDPEEAVAFLRWFLNKEQQVKMATEAREIPANVHSMDGIAPLLRGFAMGMNKLTPDLKLEEKNEVREVLEKGVQSIIIGETIPQDVLKQAWETKQRISKK